MTLKVTSYKGDVGKTTTTVDLAAYLHRLTAALLVDGDGPGARQMEPAWNGRGSSFQGDPHRSDGQAPSQLWARRHSYVEWTNRTLQSRCDGKATSFPIGS